MNLNRYYPALLGLLQGLILYFFYEQYKTNISDWFAHGIVYGCLTTTIYWQLTSPTQINSRWLVPPILAGVILGINAAYLPFETLFSKYVLWLLTNLVICVFYQMYYLHPWFKLSYQSWFEHTWCNLWVLVLAGLFTILSWGLLLFCELLCKSLGIEVYSKIILSEAFFYIVIPTLFGFGISIMKWYPNLIDTACWILLTLGKYLFIPMAIISCFYFIALPFHIDVIKQHGALLLWTVAILLVLFNMVIQANAKFQWEFSWLRFVTSSVLLLLPVIVGWVLIYLIQLLWQSAQQFDKFITLVLGIVLLVYTLVYAVAALQASTRKNYALIVTANPWLAILLGCATWWVTSPLFF